ncbi:PKD domain-containing protein [Candidatus Bipolaricaulota bacterium]|nr:PKD domain-containing protein [Candidatus Bipolaricaulota bacterium]
MCRKRNRFIEVLLLILVVSLVTGGCALFSNVPPVARLAVTPSRGVSPLEVQFNGSASYDPDGRITRWSWDFGDGERGSGKSVTHRFTEPGTRLVRLTVRDNRGATTVGTTLIEVVEFNQPPVANMTFSPASGAAPLFVIMDGTTSTDEDGSIKNWTWDFGDGGTASGSIVSHRYLIPGTYTVKLTVSDDLLGTDTSSAKIVVSKAAPFLRQYEWNYAGRHFNWTVSIPSSLYYEYQSRIRGAWDQRDYDDYVLDPLDDDYLEGLVDWIRAEVGSDFYKIVECLFHFVQAAIDYAYDPLWYEYPRYPVETLVDETGDCEDTAILYASLVRTLGAGAMLVAVDTDHNGVPDHMITLVPVSQAYADATVCTNGCVNSFWTYGGQLYAFAETTGEPDLMGYYFELGCDPWGLTEIDFKITWDVSSIDVGPKIKRWDPVSQ